MASVTGMTAEAINALMNEMITSMRIDDNGQIIYKTRGGSETNAGPLIPAKQAVEAAWPVGSLFYHTTPTNPSDILGVGTWVRYGKGRVIVSQDDAQTEFNAVDKTGGGKSVTLTQANLPSHKHSIPSHNHQFTVSVQNVTREVGGNAASPQVNSVYPNASGSSDRTGNTTTESSGTTGAVGSSEPINNLSPYIVAYIWKRTE